MTRTAAVVTSALLPVRDALADERVLHARWASRLASHGLELQRVYPLIGAPLRLLERPPREPARYLQAERNLVALMELVPGHAAELTVVPTTDVSVSRCRELVGPACREVVLAGANPALSDRARDKRV